MRLWGRATSVNVQKVLWALAELGISAERIDVGGAYGGLDTSDYGARNPNRVIPTLEDGELTMWESNAVVRYIAEAYGRGILRPDNPREAARADQWMDWQQTTLAKPMSDLFWEAVRKPPSQRNAELAKSYVVAAAKALRVLDAQLAKTEWLGGRQFSMGDIPAGSMLWRWFTMEIDRPALPNLERWYQQLGARRAYRETIMTSYEPLRGKD
jgi:glutathione S-transferase